jgi:hypothetical protein
MIRRKPLEIASKATAAVYRGCGYYDRPGYARSADRYPRPPQFRSSVVGFPLVLILDHPG